MAKYLIDGATLTSIADAIRNGSQWDGAWQDVDITPEQMPSAIEDIRYDGYCDGEETGYAAGYDKGYDDGYEEGKADGGVDLEALGELCEWMITTDSNSYPVITIRNMHPSYYLHGVIVTYDWRGGMNVKRTTFVVSPNASKSYTPLQSSSLTFGDVQFNLEDVRWKASAT